MPKHPVSITLDADNLVWLRGRTASQKRRSLSETLDDLVTAARTDALGSGSRSVIGTIDIAADDPGLDQADAYVRGEVAASLARPLVVRETGATYSASPASKRRPAGVTARRRRRA
jgi:hypothetical protein